MKADLSTRVAKLAPSIRRVTLQLADTPTYVTRKQARSRLAQLSLSDRANLGLDAGERLVADLANGILGMRIERKTRGLTVTPRTSPVARERNYFFGRLNAPIGFRLICRNRARIKALAHGTVLRGATALCSLFVYEVEDNGVGIRQRGYPGPVAVPGALPCHDLYVPRRWRGQTMRVGDGSGIIDGHLILSAHPVEGAQTPYVIHELIVAAVECGRVVARFTYSASSPVGHSMHSSFRRAREALESLRHAGEQGTVPRRDDGRTTVGADYGIAA